MMGIKFCTFVNEFMMIIRALFDNIRALLESFSNIMMETALELTVLTIITG